MATAARRPPSRFRDADGLSGVTRATLSKLAQELGLNETQVTHHALRQLETSVLPAYEADDGPLRSIELKIVEPLAGWLTGLL
jgi:hypothetical protein